MNKAMIFIATTLLAATSCTARQAPVQAEVADEGAAEGKRVLVAYFSCTGTTESVAKSIAEATGAKLYRIAPKVEYTAADLDWRNKQSRSSKEMADDTSRPELADHDAQVEQYDVVFVGFPVWWDLCPRAVNTFMEAYDFKGKTVIPFATSGGSTIRNSESVLHKTYADGINWRPGRLLGYDSEEAKKWAAEAIK